MSKLYPEPVILFHYSLARPRVLFVAQVTHPDEFFKTGLSKSVIFSGIASYLQASSELSLSSVPYRLQISYQ